MNGTVRKYAILSAGEPPTEEMVKKYGSYFHIFKKFLCGGSSPKDECKDNLENKNEFKEEWKEYKLFNNEFPTLDEVEKLDGVIISGSKYDSFDNEIPWIIKLRSLIWTILEGEYSQDPKEIDPYKHIKVIGICFGHQVISHSLPQGRAARNPKSPWEVGLSRVMLTPEFYKCFPYFEKKYLPEIGKNKNGEGCLNVLRYHQDCVLSLPKKAVLLAYSEESDNEMLCIGKRVLSCQGHPERETGYLLDLVDHNVSIHRISAQINAKAKDSILKLKAHDNDIWSIIFSEFLRR